MAKNALYRECLAHPHMHADSHPSLVQPGAAFKFTQHKHKGYCTPNLTPSSKTMSMVHGMSCEFDKLFLCHTAMSGIAIFKDTMLDNVAVYASATYQVVSTWNQTPVWNIYVA